LQVPVPFANAVVQSAVPVAPQCLSSCGVQPEPVP
jgi:hypothetical protein